MMKKVLTSTTFLVASMMMLFSPFQSVAAVTASDWKAGRIIDDSVFTNPQSMSVTDIQNFLNGKVPACDTNGSRPSDMGGVDYDGNGVVTRREYAQYRGYGVGFIFTCLKDYWEVPKTSPGNFIPASNYGGAAIPAGAKSAAQLISDAAYKYNISPKALLVKLATESAGPLTSDDWPFPKQYYYAMGAHCPDSGPNGSANCDANYAGFSIQMDEAASLLRWYIDSMQTSWWSYKRPYQTNSILWNVVERGCGASDVYIESKATAALYTYTPYQPNSAALNNMYGEGDYCSAYGNRNFWRVWNDWFGPTREGVTITSPLKITGASAVGGFTGSLTTASFNITNDSASPVDVGGMAVAVRDQQGRNFDYALKSMTIPARSTVEYRDSQVFSGEGTYTFEIVNYSNGYWNNTLPLSNIPSNQRKVTTDIFNMPTIVSGLNGAVDLRAGKSQSISITVRNNSAARRDLGKIGIGVRGPNGENMDLGLMPLVLDPGQTQVVSYGFRPPYSGVYRISVIATRDNGGTWESNYPAAQDQNTKRNVDASAKPQVTVTSSLTSSNQDPHEGQTTILSFTLKNFGDTSVDLGKIGLWGRDPQNRNIDPGVVPLTLAAGEEKVLNFPMNLAQIGKYSFGVLGTRDGLTWDQGPAAETVQSKQLDVNTKDGVSIKSGLSMTGSTNNNVGSIYTLSFTVKNYKNTSVDLGKIGLWGRDPQNRNIDPGVVPLTLAAGEEKVLNFPMKALSEGQYTYGILQTLNNGQSWGSGPVLELNQKNTLSKLFTNTLRISQSLSTGSLHKNQTTILSFTLKNFGDTSVDLGKIGLWGRDPQNRNIDPGVVPLTLAAGEEKVITMTSYISQEGNYIFGIMGTVDNGRSWYSGPQPIQGVATQLKAVAKASVTLTSSLIANGTHTKNTCDTLSFTLKNFGDTSVDLGKIGLWGRDPQNRNIDPGVVPLTLAAGEEKVLNFPACYGVTGAFTFGVLQSLDNARTWTAGPQKENDNLLNVIQIVVD